MAYYFLLHLRMKTTAICNKYCKHYRVKRSMQETEKCLTAMKLQTTHTKKAIRFETVKSSVITLRQQDAN